MVKFLAQVLAKLPYRGVNLEALKFQNVCMGNLDALNDSKRSHTKAEIDSRTRTRKSKLQITTTITAEKRTHTVETAAELSRLHDLSDQLVHV